MAIIAPRVLYALTVICSAFRLKTVTDYQVVLVQALVGCVVFAVR